MIICKMHQKEKEAPNKRWTEPRLLTTYVDGRCLTPGKPHELDFRSL